MLSHFPSDDYTAAANRAVATYNVDDTRADNTGRYQGSELEHADREKFRQYADKGMYMADKKQVMKELLQRKERKKRDEEANKVRKALSALSPPQVSSPLRRYKSAEGGKKTRRRKKQKRKKIKRRRKTKRRRKIKRRRKTKRRRKSGLFH